MQASSAQSPHARVRAAMRATPRAAFLPADVQASAHLDRPLAIGWNATCSQPSTVARMLELLDAREGDRVLDVGSGSGWTTAILARLVGATGVVTGVERVPELVEFARERLAHLRLDCRIVAATTGVLGLPDDGPFDRILVSADFGRMPTALVGQLADGGRMVAPVADVMTVVTRRGDAVSTRAEPGRYVFVPLRED